MNDEPKPPTISPVADDLERIANHISETLYYASGALKKASTLADERFIRHDDYDRLRVIAKDIRIAALRDALEAEERRRP